MASSELMTAQGGGTVENRRKRNATISDIRRAWLKAKIRELGALLQKLPADRRARFEADILAPPEPQTKRTQPK